VCRKCSGGSASRSVEQAHASSSIAAPFFFLTPSLTPWLLLEVLCWVERLTLKTWTRKVLTHSWRTISSHSLATMEPWRQGALCRHGPSLLGISSSLSIAYAGQWVVARCRKAVTLATSPLCCNAGFIRKHSFFGLSSVGALVRRLLVPLVF
jgi:hypothetical protein